MTTLMQRCARIRMVETGEKYTVALRVVKSDTTEFERLRDIDRSMQRRKQYPATDRDRLDRRHVLSAWETSRRHH